MAKHRKIVDATTWKNAPDDERDALALCKSHADTVDVIEKGDDGEPLENVLGWTISTEGRDRDGDRIPVSGWDLKNFKRNPVVPWGHNYQEPPIGKVVKLEVDKEKGRLYAQKKFATREQYPFAGMIYELAKAGYIKAASVGFIPREYEQDVLKDDESDEIRVGLLFKKKELLESSVVTVPSNPGALHDAKSIHGIDLTPYVAFAEKILDGEKGAGLWVPRKQIEELFLVVQPPKPTVVVPAAIEPVIIGDAKANTPATESGVITIGLDGKEITKAPQFVIEDTGGVEVVRVERDGAVVFGEPFKEALRAIVREEIANAKTQAPTTETPPTEEEQLEEALRSLYVLALDEQEPDENETEDPANDGAEEALLAQVGAAVKELLGARERNPLKES